jgi:DNA polymerase (family 10)
MWSVLLSVQVNNLIVAGKLKLISNLLQVDGGSIWQRKPYDKAAEILSDLNVPASTIPNFKTYAGIGAGTAGAIDSIIKTGTCLVLDDLRKKYPKAEKAFGLTIVSGVGVKTAISLYNSGITTLEELSDACDLGKVSNGQIVRGVKLALKSRGRLPINEVLPVMIPLLESIRNRPEVTQAEFCGSVRRGKETIKDVDVIVVSTDRAKTAAFFDTLGDTLIAGVEKARVMVPLDARTSVQFDLLFADASNFGAALAYFTGSKEHNISMRQRAVSFGLTLNEHGFATKAGGVRTDGATEAGIYKKLKLPWCPPEIREGSNLPTTIPKLVTRSDITGDWHMHTFWSADAKDSVLDMAVAARVRGLQMIGLTDHTEKQYGWDPNKIKDRAAECRDASDFLDMPIYPACETGVNKDGSLDWDDKYLKQMAYVIASIHKSHAVDPVKRLIAAARHPMVKIIGHPTGRSMGRRDIPQDNWADLFKVCAQEGVLVEINGARLDLPVDLIKMAKAEGCKFVLNGDAHSINELHWQDYAITLARRAGLTKSDLGKPSWSAV